MWLLNFVHAARFSRIVLLLVYLKQLTCDISKSDYQQDAHEELQNIFLGNTLYDTIMYETFLNNFASETVLLFSCRHRKQRKVFNLNKKKLHARRDQRMRNP